jgi:hypothetical protein
MVILRELSQTVLEKIKIETQSLHSYINIFLLKNKISTRRFQNCIAFLYPIFFHDVITIFRIYQTTGKLPVNVSIVIFVIFFSFFSKKKNDKVVEEEKTT